MKKYLFSAFMLTAGLAGNVQAVSLEFKFDVNSSGPSMYACDAGIKHDDHYGRICYDRETKESCDPKLCTSEEQCNCVCTGGATTDVGEYKQDYLKTSYAPWTDNGEVPYNTVHKTVSAGKEHFNRVFPLRAEWDHQLTNLSFNLGSERYGAEFYVDICYRGPQIEYWKAYKDTHLPLNDYPNFAVKAQSTITDLITSNGLKYSKLSDLKVKAIVTCDLQGAGLFQTAEVYNHYDLSQAHEIYDISSPDYNRMTGFQPFNAGSNLFLINDWINLGNGKTPRFCKVRYVFRENRRDDYSHPLAQIRKWKHHKAKICTYTDISEPDTLE